jgi:hypothetical protein
MLLFQPTNGVLMYLFTAMHVLYGLMYPTPGKYNISRNFSIWQTAENVPSYQHCKATLQFIVLTDNSSYTLVSHSLPNSFIFKNSSLG